MEVLWMKILVILSLTVTVFSEPAGDKVSEYLKVVCIWARDGEQFPVSCGFCMCYRGTPLCEDIHCYTLCNDPYTQPGHCCGECNQSPQQRPVRGVELNADDTFQLNCIQLYNWLGIPLFPFIPWPKRLLLELHLQWRLKDLWEDDGVPQCSKGGEWIQ